MSPEEREAFREVHVAERMKNMSPEQKKKFQARMKKRKQIHEKIKDMSPEERQAFRETRIAEKMKDMTPEEQEELGKLLEKRKERWGEGRAAEESSE